MNGVAYKAPKVGGLCTFDSGVLRVEKYSFLHGLILALFIRLRGRMRAAPSLSSKCRAYNNLPTLSKTRQPHEIRGRRTTTLRERLGISFKPVF